MDHLDRSLEAIATYPPSLLTDPAQPAGLVRAMALRAELADAGGDADAARRWSSSVQAVWLSAERTSPYAFYQYWINVDDADVGNCLRMLTELSREEIESLDAVRQSDAGKRDSQRRLAEALTRLVHGDDGLATAQRATDIFFGAEISDLKDEQLTAIFADVPSSKMGKRSVR